EYLDYVPEAVDLVVRQVQTENQLEQSEARLAAVIRTAMDAILTVEADGNISLFNTAAELMFLCRAAQAVGQPITRFMPKVPWEGPAAKGVGSHSAEESFSVSLRSQTQGRRADGEEFPL